MIFFLKIEITGLKQFKPYLTMTKLTSYDEVQNTEEQKLDLNNSVEIDEEDPMVQVIEEIPKKKNYRMVILVTSGFLVFVALCIFAGIMIGMYISEDGVHYIIESGDVLEMEDTNMGARFSNWKSHKKKSCSDKFGCCEIQFGCENQTIKTLHLSPYRIMKQDKKGSNCPSIDTLTQTYNEKFKKQCVIDGCHLSPKCPSVYDLVYLYNTEWYDHTQDMVVLTIMFIVVIVMVGMYCCHSQCFENCPAYRHFCNQK